MYVFDLCHRLQIDDKIARVFFPAKSHFHHRTSVHASLHTIQFLFDFSDTAAGMCLFNFVFQFFFLSFFLLLLPFLSQQRTFFVRPFTCVLCIDWSACPLVRACVRCEWVDVPIYFYRDTNSYTAINKYVWLVNLASIRPHIYTHSHFPPLNLFSLALNVKIIDECVSGARGSLDVRQTTNKQY